MRIGGLLKLSLIDYPGKIAAVVFTQGCNFRCPYCHNPELVVPEQFHPSLPEADVLDFLQKRAGQLEGVVVTGGEPTLQKDLSVFLKKVKDLGYSVKLDTNGSHPSVLKDLLALDLIDYIAMDVKVPPEKYGRLTSLPDCPARIRESIATILDSGRPHEFRTTLAPPLCPAEDLPQMALLVKRAGKYRLQRFIPRDTILDKELPAKYPKNLSNEEVAGLQRQWGIG